MRRFLCVVMAGMMAIGCLCTGVGAADEINLTSEENKLTEVAIMRATGNFDGTIKANSESVLNPKFSLAAGETVRIRASYSPEDASMDFGLVDSDGIYHYINVKTGSIDKTIKVPENGSYTVLIRNNSSTSVKVTGTVRY